MYTISKQFHFSASHILEGLADDHPCSRLHGHNYIAEIVLSSPHLDATGFIVDFNDLREFGRILDDEFDHRHLNDVMDLQSSAENLAAYLYGRAKALWPEVVQSVRISETPRTWAEYQG